MATEVPAVATAMRIMEAIAAEAPNPVSAGALAAGLNVNRSTCYNILDTLQAGGWVNKAGQRAGWTLGPAVAALSARRHVEVQDEIDRLCQRLGCVVFAGEEDATGGYAVVAVADPGRGIRVTVNVGDRFSFSTPGLMYAFWPYRPWEEFIAVAQRHALERFTEHTTVDIDEIARNFARVRQRGFGHSIKEYNTAHSGATATVFGPDGAPRLAIVTLAFSSDLDWDNLEQIGETLREAAARITARIGGKAPDLKRFSRGH